MLQNLAAYTFSQHVSALPHDPSNRLRRTHLCHQLNIIRNLIPSIQAPVLPRLITNRQHFQHLPLVDTHFPRELRQASIRLVPGLIDDVDVEEALLILE
jgi:hypothetical protein